MDCCFAGDYNHGDQMDIDVTIYNTKEPHQKYRIGTVIKSGMFL